MLRNMLKNKHAAHIVRRMLYYIILIIRLLERPRHAARL